jgi:transcriptional antiterminator NusG
VPRDLFFENEGRTKRMTLPRWHVVLCRPTKAISVSNAIAATGLQVWCPSYRQGHLVRGRQRYREISYFGGYVFVRFDGTDPVLWHDIHDLEPVSGFMGGERPDPVPDRDIALMMELHTQIGDAVAMAEEGGPVYALGQVVIVTHGLFVGQTSEIFEISADSSLLRLKTACFGRFLLVYVPSAWCSIVEDGRLVVGSPPTPAKRRKRGGRTRWQRRVSQATSRDAITTTEAE